eukprot:6199836-Pleurochrysis_carterae.AAC.1
MYSALDSSHASAPTSICERVHGQTGGIGACMQAHVQQASVCRCLPAYACACACASACSNACACAYVIVYACARVRAQTAASPSTSRRSSAMRRCATPERCRRAAALTAAEAKRRLRLLSRERTRRTSAEYPR